MRNGKTIGQWWIQGGDFLGENLPENSLRSHIRLGSLSGQSWIRHYWHFSHPFDSGWLLSVLLSKLGQSPSVCLFPEQLTPTPRNNRQFTKCDQRLKSDDQNTKRISSQYWSWSQKHKKRPCTIHCYVLQCLTYHAKNLCCAIHIVCRQHLVSVTMCFQLHISTKKIDHLSRNLIMCKKSIDYCSSNITLRERYNFVHETFFLTLKSEYTSELRLSV